jgi:hypothetical protein
MMMITTEVANRVILIGCVLICFLIPCAVGSGQELSQPVDIWGDSDAQSATFAALVKDLLTWLKNKTGSVELSLITHGEALEDLVRGVNPMVAMVLEYGRLRAILDDQVRTLVAAQDEQIRVLTTRTNDLHAIVVAQTEQGHLLTAMANDIHNLAVALTEDARLLKSATNDIHQLAVAQAEDARTLKAVTHDIHQLAVAQAEDARRLKAVTHDIHQLAVAQTEDARRLKIVTSGVHKLAVVEADHGRRLAILRDNVTAIAAVEDQHTKALDHVKNQLGEWRGALDYIVDLISGRKQLKAARKASVRIVAFAEDPDYATRGCGSLVEMEGNHFVVTVDHLADKFQANLSTVDLELEGGAVFHPSGPALRFQGALDLALLPVEFQPEFEGITLTVSRTPIVVGMPLWGMSFQAGGFVVQHCRSLECEEAITVETDCAGTEGFSGTGYVGDDGVLAAVHVGDGVFDHADGPSSGMNTIELRKAQRKTLVKWNETSRECSVDTVAIPPHCFEEILGSMEQICRNPRAKVAEAYHLWALVDQEGPGALEGAAEVMSDPSSVDDAPDVDQANADEKNEIGLPGV